MKLIIDIPENELTEDEIAECIRIAEENFSNVMRTENVIPLSVLQEIRQEIENNRNEVCTDIDDEIAYHVNCGLYSGLDSALEILDKHIKEYTE